MVIAEVRIETATVRIHDAYDPKETRRAMEEAGRIVSQAYQRRMSGAMPGFFGNTSIFRADR